MRAVPLLTSIAFVVSIAAGARAADPAAAEAVFAEAKRLMAQHQYAEACTKFAESQRQDPGIGTLFHFADCEEQIGKTASAWAAFMEVAAQAKGQGETAREKVARDRAAALEPKLAKLTIDAGAEKATPGLELVRDGNVVGPGQWGVAVPVDPGVHEIEARAPDKGTWHAKVTVVEGSRQSVMVPLLSPVPRAEVVAVAPGSQSAGAAPSSTTIVTSGEMPVSGRRGGTQRGVGIALGAVGLAGVGVGTYFGVVSLQKHDDSAGHCAGNTCDAVGVALRDDARRAGNASTIAFAVGGAALVGGLVTFLTAPSDRSIAERAAVHAQVAVGPGGLSLSGSW